VSTAARISLDALPLVRELHVPVDYSGRLIAELVTRRLFCPETADGSGGCAVAAECFDDGRRWRVQLDGRHHWSDGRPVLARAVVAGTERSLASRSNGVSLFLATEAGAGAAVRAVREDVVEFRFRRPVGFAPALLSLPAFAPYATGIGADGAAVSAGDYAVGEWAADRVVLRRQDSATTGPDELRLLHVPTAAEAVARYAAGELEATSPTGFGVAQIDALAGHPDLVGKPIDIFGSLDLGRRAPGGWLASAALRRTVSGVLERAVLEKHTRGLVLPWRWPGPDALGAGAPEGQVRGADRDAARRAVSEPLDIAFADFDPNAEVVDAVADMLRRELGVEVRTTRLSFDEYVRASMRMDFCLLYSLTTPGYPHPAASLSDWRSSGRAASRLGLADPELDTRLDASEAAPDVASAPLWERVVDRWCELLPKIPLVRVQAWLLRGSGLRALEVTTSGLMRFPTAGVDVKENNGVR